ncbi:MAG: TetR/AcrR family transcriptional regulator [Eubacteriales bacterium]|nr:TetR/AcrR family transcriptional regulator [Eubacteriales bacterium]
METQKSGKRALRTEANRELIIKTALQLFNEKGYDKTTMADIIHASGLTNGTIYHLFGNKQSIISGIYDYYFDVELGLNENQEEKIQNPLPHIRQFLLDYEQLWMDAGWALPANTYRIYENLYFKKNTEELLLDNLSSTSKEELKQFIRAAQEYGTIRKDLDAKFIVTTIFVFGRGLLYQWSLAKGKYDLVTSSIPYWDTFLPTFLAEKETV